MVAIAIDSKGLKRFVRSEGHKVKHKVIVKRRWRKAYLAVDNNHIIQNAVLTHKDLIDNQSLMIFTLKSQSLSSILPLIKMRYFKR